MEFRRSVNSEEPLSVLVLLLNANSDPENGNQVANIYGDAAKALLLKMRKGDSLYLFESGAFGIVLPGFNTASATRVVERCALSLTNASDSGTRFSFMSRVINYPEEFKSARDMEQAARSLVPARIPSLPNQREDEALLEAAS
jgi:hypothetical protein